jgi:L-Ala-D/L-Glu epimerase
MSPELPPLERADAYHVSVPFKHPFQTARGLIDVRRSWIVRLVDLDGHEGFGEVALDPAASAADEERTGLAVRGFVASLGAGRLPLPTNHGGAETMTTDHAVVAGIDEALEAIGRAAADPVAAAAPISVAVNATLDIEDATLAADAAVRAVAGGFTCLKLKVGPEPRAALAERVGAVRAAVGPSVALRLDANCSWDYSMAAERLEALAAFDLEYVEQPLTAADLAGHAALRRDFNIPIALDESVASEADARAILAANAADILVVKPARVGGPQAVRAIAATAASSGVPVVLSTFFETGIGSCAAIRAAAGLPPVGRERAHGLATAGLLVHDLLAQPAQVVGGRIVLRDLTTVDETALLRFTVEAVAWNR